MFQFMVRLGKFIKLYICTSNHRHVAVGGACQPEARSHIRVKIVKIGPGSMGSFPKAVDVFFRPGSTYT